MAGHYTDFKQNMKDMIRKELRGVHTALPGTIVDVDTENARVTVKPAGYIMFNGEQYEYPTIGGVPVVFPYLSGEETGIYFPLKEDDPCLIVFAEQGLGLWAEQEDANNAVRHAYNNAICIPGIMKDPSDDFTEAIEDGAFLFRLGDTRVKATEESGDISVELADGATLSLSHGENEVSVSVDDDALTLKLGDNAEISIEDGKVTLKASEVSLSGDTIALDGAVKITGSATLNGSSIATN